MIGKLGNDRELSERAFVLGTYFAGIDVLLPDLYDRHSTFQRLKNQYHESVGVVSDVR